MVKIVIPFEQIIPEINQRNLYTHPAFKMLMKHYDEIDFQEETWLQDTSLLHETIEFFEQENIIIAKETLLTLIALDILSQKIITSHNPLLIIALRIAADKHQIAHHYIDNLIHNITVNKQTQTETVIIQNYITATKEIQNTPWFVLASQNADIRIDHPSQEIDVDVNQPQFRNCIRERILSTLLLEIAEMIKADTISTQNTLLARISSQQELSINTVREIEAQQSQVLAKKEWAITAYTLAATMLELDHAKDNFTKNTTIENREVIDALLNKFNEELKLCATKLANVVGTKKQLEKRTQFNKVCQEFVDTHKNFIMNIKHFAQLAQQLFHKQPIHRELQNYIAQCQQIVKEGEDWLVNANLSPVHSELDLKRLLTTTCLESYDAYMDAVKIATSLFYPAERMIEHSITKGQGSKFYLYTDGFHKIQEDSLSKTGNKQAPESLLSMLIRPVQFIARNLLLIKSMLDFNPDESLSSKLKQLKDYLEEKASQQNKGIGNAQEAWIDCKIIAIIDSRTTLKTEIGLDPAMNVNIKVIKQYCANATKGHALFISNLLIFLELTSRVAKNPTLTITPHHKFNDEDWIAIQLDKLDKLVSETNPSAPQNNEDVIMEWHKKLTRVYEWIIATNRDEKEQDNFTRHTGKEWITYQPEFQRIQKLYHAFTQKFAAHFDPKAASRILADHAPQSVEKKSPLTQDAFIQELKRKLAGITKSETTPNKAPPHNANTSPTTTMNPLRASISISPDKTAVNKALPIKSSQASDSAVASRFSIWHSAQPPTTLSAWLTHELRCENMSNNLK